MNRIESIRAIIHHATDATTHAVRLTHSDRDGETFRAYYVAGQYRGASEIIAADRIVRTY